MFMAGRQFEGYFGLGSMKTWNISTSGIYNICLFPYSRKPAVFIPCVSSEAVTVN
jgi:hypothetical protein